MSDLSRVQKSSTTMGNNPAALVESEKRLVAQLTGGGVDDMQLNDTGWTSRVYLVDDGKFVFKFPRMEEVKKEYVQEIKAYRMLESISSHIQVPRIKWTDPNNDYFGYEGIVGNSLASDIRLLNDQQKTALGRAIGDFLKQLHQLSLDDPHVMGVEDEIKQAQEKYAGCHGILAQHFNKAEIGQLDVFFGQTMPETMRRLGEEAVLCHGDLGYWNMILKSDESLGFIDFGDIGYYDRSKDFCGLQDKIMLEAALNTYGDTEQLRQKIAIRQQYLPFFDLQYFSANGNAAKITETTDAIKQLLGDMGA